MINSEVHKRLKEAAIRQIGNIKQLEPALKDGQLMSFKFEERDKFRIHQFASELGVTDYCINKTY